MKEGATMMPSSQNPLPEDPARAAERRWRRALRLEAPAEDAVTRADAERREVLRLESALMALGVPRDALEEVAGYLPHDNPGPYLRRLTLALAELSAEPE
jgi:hypothetical protein